MSAWKAKGRTGWISGKPQTADEVTMKLKFGGRSDKFLCGFCLHKFKIGDYYRWVYTNGYKIKGCGGNPFACKDCDTGNNEEMAQRFADIRNDFEDRRKVFNV